MYSWFGLLALAWAITVPAAAQDTAASRRDGKTAITLQEALRQAHINSPTYRQVLNDAAPAMWGVRNAYGNLLPQLNVSSSFGYTGAGEANFGLGLTRQTSSLISSGYGIGINWQMNGRVLSGPGLQKALRRAVDEDVNGAGVALETEITDQYLTALQAAAQAEVERQQVRRNEEFLRLAQARHQVGQATLIEVRQAEVTLRTSEVTLLRTEQGNMEAKLELLRRMGIPPAVPVDQVVLTDTFPVVEPRLELGDLLKMAETRNPSLQSLRAREEAARWDVRVARSDFLPALSLQAGWSGFTQQYTNNGVLLNQALTSAQGQAAGCQFDNQLRSALGIGGGIPDCFGAAGLTDGGAALLDPVTQDIRRRNNVFPFRYTGQPFNASLGISLPIFTGFGRTLRLSQARAQRQDAEESVRGRQLQVQTEVHSRYLALQTAYRTIAMQAGARDAARDQLRLATDRYRLGAGNSLEVTDAETAVQRAEGDYITAVYDYHKAIAALEAAVGRPLR